jgi:beta-glucanase (GH16 family)
VADFMRSTQHIRVHDGLCSISAVRQQSPNGLPWQSGLMSTRTKFGQMYGKFEMRAKLPKGMGLWPAFWLLPEAGRDGPPEIDIMEQYSNPLGTKPVDASATSGTVHYGTNYSSDHGQHGVWHYAGDYTLDWHTYAAEWRSDRVVFYVDGQEIGRVTQNIPKIRMYLIVNLALGASWAGMPDSSTPSPSTMDIDYIRAWA